jgi:hypothetical protein
LRRVPLRYLNLFVKYFCSPSFHIQNSMLDVRCSVFI